ncbi:MAG TPA: molybdopterin dinucleotide binding domain-containing protein, partial [Acidimicrobiia bacterium]|nr:molybdopterin dinucleotide binding domain-containing protein [Acidimicrobiia bacterium]
ASGTGSLSTLKPGLTEADGGDAEAVPELVDAASAAMAAAPALHVWDRSTPAVPPDAPDAYSLRLVVTRTLYDAGSTAASSPAIAALAEGVALVVHPSDLSRVGVAHEGDDVLVTSAQSTVTLPARTDTAIAPGTALIAFARPGSTAANELLDATAPVTDVRVETTR